MANREVVNEIISMIMQGFREDEILTTLKEEGHSYKDIKDAIDQAQTKIELAKAAGDESLLTEDMEEEKPERPRKVESKQKMTKSIISQPRMPHPQYSAEEQQDTETRDEEEIEEGIPAPGSMQQAHYPQQEYSQQKFAYQPQEADISELDEMVEEIVNDKIREIETKIGNLDSFKQGLQKEIKNLGNSLEKFETKIKDKDTEIISKIQEIVFEIQLINSEIIALENVFLKILSPLVSNIKEIEKVARAAQNINFKKAKDMEKLTENIEIQKKRRDETRETSKLSGQKKSSLDKLMK